MKTCRTACATVWSRGADRPGDGDGITNGKLLALAEAAGFDLMVTI